MTCMKLWPWRLLSKDGSNRSISSAKTPVKQEKSGLKKARTLKDEEDRKGPGRDKAGREKAWCLALHPGASSLEGGGVGLGQQHPGPGEHGAWAPGECRPPLLPQALWFIDCWWLGCHSPRERENLTSQEKGQKDIAIWSIPK